MSSVEIFERWTTITEKGKNNQVRRRRLHTQFGASFLSRWVTMNGKTVHRTFFWDLTCSWRVRIMFSSPVRSAGESNAWSAWGEIVAI